MPNGISLPPPIRKVLVTDLVAKSSILLQGLVHIVGERKQRELAKQIIGENVAAEKGAFTFPGEKGGEVIREAPFVYVPNLIRKVSDVVLQYQRQAL